MASFFVDGVTSNINAKEAMNTMTTSRNSNRSFSSNRSDYRGGAVKPNEMYSSTYDVVGINVNQVPNMKNAIDNYVDAVKEYLSGINTKLNTQQAIKGTGMEEAVSQYIDDVVKYCKAVCSNLLAFSDKLTAVQKAWETSDTNMSNTIKGASSDVNAAATEYSKQF